MNEAHVAALRAERAGVAPYVGDDPAQQRRLADIDEQLALATGNEARAAHYEKAEESADVDVSAVSTDAPAVDDTRSTAPLEMAVTPKRGARNAKES